MVVPLLFLFCAVHSQAQLRIGSTNSLWDISQGTTVLNYSRLNSSAGPPYPQFDVGDIFGGTYYACSLERYYDTIFADGNPDGFTNYVEWHTASNVTVQSFDLYAAGDAPPCATSREFASFKLKAKSPGSTNFDLTLFTFVPTHPYTYVSNQFPLLVSADIKAVTAQDFRAEFVNRNGARYDGPRIFGLDAFSQRRHFVMTIAQPPAKICWTSFTNTMYQVQYSTNLANNLWSNLGEPVAGSEGITSITDITPGQPQRFYRVVQLP